MPVGDKAVNAEDQTTFCDGEEPTYRRKQDTHTHTEREREREREREAQRINYIQEGNSYKRQQQLY